MQDRQLRFYNMITKSADGIVIVDNERIIRFINPAGQELFGRGSEELIGKEFGFPVAASDSTELEIIQPGTSIRIAEMRVVETEWEGEPAYLASLRDISERKEIQKTLETTTRKLKQTVRELEKANRKILEQQKSIIEEERLKVVMQMAGATAHEINQPLTVLLGEIELIRMAGDVPREAAGRFDSIETSGRKIAEIVTKVQKLRRDKTKAYSDSTFIIDFDQELRILSVEDSDYDFDTIKEILEDNDKITLQRAETIDKAFLTLDRTKFDVVLLDYLLPDGNGYDFLKKMGTRDTDIPVIVITGRGDDMIASQIIWAGAEDYLSKETVSSESLFRSINNTMEKDRLRKEIRRAQNKIREMSKSGSGKSPHA